MPPSLVAPYIESLAPYVPGKPIEEVTREYGVPDPIKLASNENPIGPSPKALAAIQAALGHLHLYPDGAAFTLRQGLSKFLGVPSNEIVLGNGTNEIITLLARTFLADGDEAIFSATTFLCYRISVQSCGRKFFEVPMREHRADLEAMARAVTARTRLLYLSNPDNPNGTYNTKSELEALMAKVPERCLVVLDEAYFEFADAPDYPNGLTLRSRYPNLIVLRTFSKAYGLAGLRVGYGVARPEVVTYLDRVRDTFNVNSLGQVGALAALEDREHVRKTQETVAAGRTWLAKELPRFGFKVIPSLANFLLVDVGSPAQKLFEQMLPRGIHPPPARPLRLAKRAAHLGGDGQGQPAPGRRSRELESGAMIVAIDGPAGAGKSTVARELAARLGLTLVDTGAIYRTAAFAAKERGVPPDDDWGLAGMLPDLAAQLRFGSSGKVQLGERDVSALIRSPEMSQAASAISARPVVRDALLGLQQRLGRGAPAPGAVLEGRDIGTVVFPDAEAKFFLTASPRVRAERRFLELKSRGIETTVDAVLQDQEKRDRDDSSRAVAPLKQADDAVLIDSTDLDLAHVVDCITETLRSRKLL